MYAVTSKLCLCANVLNLTNEGLILPFIHKEVNIHLIGLLRQNGDGGGSIGQSWRVFIDMIGM